MLGKWKLKGENIMINRRNVFINFALVCMILMFSINPTLAAENKNNEKKVDTQVLIKKEIVEFQGTKIKISTYDDNGVLVETMEVISCKDDSTVAQVLLEYSAIRETKQLGDDAMPLDFNDIELLAKKEPAEVTTLALSRPTYFTSTAKSSSNSNCFVTQTGWFTGEIMSPFLIKQYSGKIQGLYSGSTTPSQIQLSETYTFNNIGFSISWPAGISAQSSNSVGSWSSLAYPNTKLATAYRLNFEGKSLVSIFSLTINSRTDIYFSGTSYPASTSSKINIWDWI